MCTRPLAVAAASAVVLVWAVMREAMAVIDSLLSDVTAAPDCASKMSTCNQVAFSGQTKSKHGCDSGSNHNLQDVQLHQDLSLNLGVFSTLEGEFPSYA